jgi:hypothetical protein
MLNGYAVAAQLTAIMVAATAIVAAPLAHAREHRLECPRKAPLEWSVPKPAKLDQVAVLSQLKGMPIDDRSPPSLVPDRGYARGSVWHNIWLMGDEQGWSHFVDCRYRGSERVLRLKADGLKECEQIAQPYTSKGGVAENAAQALVCD